MLAAVQSLYASGTLSMKTDGTVGQPAVQRMGLRQGCPLSPTLFEIFFDFLHDHLQAAAPTAGLQLRSGRWRLRLCMLMMWHCSHGRLTDRNN